MRRRKVCDGVGGIECKAAGSEMDLGDEDHIGLREA
jgi:hypothetical protein